MTPTKEQEIIKLIDEKIRDFNFRLEYPYPEKIVRKVTT